MDILKLNDLESGFIERRIPFVDSVYPLLSNEKSKSAKSFVTVVKNALGLFNENYVNKVMNEIRVTGGKYEFKDNYESYLSGEISEDQIIQIPLIVHSVMFGRSGKVTSWWEYRRPYLYSSDGLYRVYSFCEFPLHIEYNADGTLSDKSHIAGITPERLDFWYHQFDLVMLRTIRSRTKMVSLSTGFDFLQLDDEISQLDEQVDKDKNTASDIYDQWR